MFAYAPPNSRRNPVGGLVSTGAASTTPAPLRRFTPPPVPTLPSQSTSSPPHHHRPTSPNPTSSTRQMNLPLSTPHHPPNSRIHLQHPKIQSNTPSAPRNCGDRPICAGLCVRLHGIARLPRLPRTDVILRASVALRAQGGGLRCAHPSARSTIRTPRSKLRKCACWSSRTPHFWA